MKKKILLCVLVFSVLCTCFCISVSASSRLPSATLHSHNPFNYSVAVYTTNLSSTPYISNKPSINGNDKVPSNLGGLYRYGGMNYEVAHEYSEPYSTSTTEVCTSIDFYGEADDVGDYYTKAILTFQPVTLYIPKNCSTLPLPVITDAPLNIGFTEIGLSSTTWLDYEYLSKDGFVNSESIKIVSTGQAGQPFSYTSSTEQAFNDMLTDFYSNSSDNSPIHIKKFYTYIPKLSQNTDNRFIQGGIYVYDRYFSTTVSDIPYTDLKPIIQYETIEADFTTWIGNAVQGFWSFQLFPNITIGTIIIAILGLMFTIGFLKYFAGG